MSVVSDAVSAANRLRANEYQCGRLNPQVADDNATVAAAALALEMFREDDAFFVNEEFVESCGLSIIHRGKDYWHVAITDMAAIRKWFPGAYMVVPISSTRGQLRSLLRSLDLWHNIKNQPETHK